MGGLSVDSGTEKSLITVVSRKGMVLSFSISMVKRMIGCSLFRCYKKPFRSKTVKVSSSYRFQILGLQVAFAIACSSNSSMKMLAVTAETGLPIAAPSCCS